MNKAKSKMNGTGRSMSKLFPHVERLIALANTRKPRKKPRKKNTIR